jgi:hypothetical protein
VIRKYKIKEAHIYLSIIVANILYRYYTSTSAFSFRVASLICTAIFYTVTIIYFAERKTIFSVASLKRNRTLHINILAVLLIFVTSISINSKDLVTLLFHPLSFLAYIICIISITVRNNTVNLLIKLAKIFNNIIPILCIIDLAIFGQLISIHILSYFVIIEFIFFDRISLRRKIYILALFISIIIQELLYDNRALVLRLVGILVAFIGMNLIKSAANRYVKYIILLGGIIVLYFTVFHFQETYDYFASKVSKSQLNTTDTRTFLFNEFFKDFKGTDWIVGRGFLGTYYSIWFFDWEGEGGDSYNRFIIEVGILQVLLKGGIALLTPFLVTIIIALKKGFTESSFYTNRFRFSLFLFIELIIMGIENVPSFSIHYMFIWLAIGIILNIPNTRKRIGYN